MINRVSPRVIPEYTYNTSAPLEVLVSLPVVTNAHHMPVHCLPSTLWAGKGQITRCRCSIVFTGAVLMIQGTRGSSPYGRLLGVTSVSELCIGKLLHAIRRKSTIQRSLTVISDRVSEISSFALGSVGKIGSYLRLFLV